MANLSEEIAAYEGMRLELERDHFGKWVIVHEGKVAGIHDTFEAAASSAVERFGAGPYLIREIGAPPLSIPVSVLYQPVGGHAAG